VALLLVGLYRTELGEDLDFGFPLLLGRLRGEGQLPRVEQVVGENIVHILLLGLDAKQAWKDEIGPSEHVSDRLGVAD